MMHPLKCESTYCKRNARWMCVVCEELVCAGHGVEVDDETHYCLNHAPAPGVAGVQQDLFTSVRPRGKRPALDGLVTGA